MSTASKTAPQQETPLVQVTMEYATAFIVQNMFYRFRGARPHLDAKLGEAYEKKYGVPMMSLLEADKIHGVYLEGLPGQGKTMSHRAACIEFVKAMNDVGVPMKFIESPTPDMIANKRIDENSFVFATIELAGETSNKEVFGLMAKRKIGNHEYMGHLPDWRLAATMMAGYGYVLFDDFPTASHQVQNATLGLLLNDSAGDLSFREMSASDWKHDGDNRVAITPNETKLEGVQRGASPVFFGMAGNRGERDGNRIFPITTATSSRVVRWDVADTLEAFVKRTFRDRNDAVGDVQFTAFLQANPDCFTMLAKKENGMLEQSSVSRTLDMFMTQARMLVHRKGGMSAINAFSRQAVDELLFDMEKIAGGCLGRTVAARIGGFYNALFLGASPIAEAIVKRGEVDEEKISKKYNNGQDADGQNFGYALASSLASYAASEVSSCLKDAKKKDFESLADINSTLSTKVRKTLMHFGYGMAMLTNRSMANFALDQFMRRLHSLQPKLFHDNGQYHIPTVEAATLLAVGMVGDNRKYPRPELNDSLLNSLTQFGALSNASATDGGAYNELNKKLKQMLGK